MEDASSLSNHRPKTRRKHLAEQFARNLIRYKERLIKDEGIPRKVNEDIEERPAKDIAYMQKDAELKQPWEKANDRIGNKERTGSKKSLIYWRE